MSLSIQLDRSGVFYPGDRLSGKVVFVVTNPFKYRRIFIVFRGNGMCTWSVGKTHYRTNYNGFDLQCNLLNGPLSTQEIAPGQSEFILPPSTYEFPFEFAVPSVHLPSTFREWELLGVKAYIRYRLKTVVVRPSRFDVTYGSDIVIHDRVNLNLVPNVGAPMRKSDEKTLCCCCCATGPITMEGMIDKGGYICGEKIRITLNVENNSRRTLSGFKATLTRKVNYSCGQHTDFQSKEIKTLSCQQAIPPGENASWNQEITVPDDLIPTSSACSSIDISYYIRIFVVTPMFSLNAYLQFDVIIGNMPLSTTAQQTATAQQQPASWNELKVMGDAEKLAFVLNQIARSPLTVTLSSTENNTPSDDDDSQPLIP